MPRNQTATIMLRLDALMKLIKTRGHITYDELFDEGLYGYDMKTFDRDRARLKKYYGVKISPSKTTKGCFFLEDEGSYFFDAALEENEAEALALGLKMVSHYLPHMKASAQELWRKLKAYIPLEAGKNAEALEQFTQILDETAGIDGRVFAVLTAAIRDEQNVNILCGPPPKRMTVLPRRIIFKDGGWYVEVSSHASGRASLCAINSIRSAIPDAEKYTYQEE